MTWSTRVFSSNWKRASSLHYPRYLQAIELRLRPWSWIRRVISGWLEQLQPFRQRYERWLAQGGGYTLKRSTSTAGCWRSIACPLFAQRLGTLGKVSRQASRGGLASSCRRAGHD